MSLFYTIDVYLLNINTANKVTIPLDLEDQNMTLYRRIFADVTVYILPLEHTTWCS